MNMPPGPEPEKLDILAGFSRRNTLLFNEIGKPIGITVTLPRFRHEMLSQE